MSKILKIIIGIITSTLLIVFIINPELTINSMMQGILLWCTKILPALFPFFVLTKIISITGTFDYISNKLTPITKLIYKTSGISSYVYICSIISGYPIGSKMLSELYGLNKIDNNEAKTIMSFTSTSGPLFIIGTVGVGMFNNKTVGYIIILAHIVGSMLNGIIYSNIYKSKSTPHIYTQNTINLDDIINSSISSIFMVGAYISLFYMLTSIIDYYNVLNPLFLLINYITKIDINIISSLTYGILEVTKGCLMLSSINLPIELQIILSCALISFGGICIHLQSYTFIKKCNIPYKTFLLQKTTQTIISIILSIILTLTIL